MTVFFELPTSVYLKILIVFIAVIIFCRWLVKKMINAGKSKAYANNAKTLIYAGFTYVAFVWLVFNVVTFEKQTKFNRDKWMAERNERYKMADDLIRSDIIAGKDSIEVKALIGVPDLEMIPRKYGIIIWAKEAEDLVLRYITWLLNLQLTVLAIFGIKGLLINLVVPV